MMSDTSGRTSPQPFAHYDPDTCSLRTWLAMLDLGLTEPSPTLPKSGLMRNGLLYQRPGWEPRIDGSGCSALLGTPRHDDAMRSTMEAALEQVETRLLGTPRKDTGKDAVMDTAAEQVRRHGRKHRLEEDIALLGTPQARDAKGPPSNGYNSGNIHNQLLPTPHANCSTGAGGIVREGANNLQTEIALLPTPTADNSRGLPSGSESGHQHLADAVILGVKNRTRLRPIEDALPDL